MRESKSLNTLGYFSRMKKSAAQLSVRKIHNHTCHLPLEDDEVNNRIYTGVLVSFRRSLWKFVTVSGANPDSKRVLKSTAQIYIEELRHFDNYSFIVHPFSQARFYWEMFMIPIFLLIFVVIPIDIALPQTSHGIMSFKLFLDVVSHVDIILYFFTGYFDERKQLIVMRFRKVVKHYLFTYFIFDLASSQPMNLYLDRHEGIYQPWKVISLLKMVRLPTLCDQLLHVKHKIHNFYNMAVRPDGVDQQCCIHGNKNVAPRTIAEAGSW
ncbi:hypothetical protein GEV33_006519 [Tenebrio molitor]|uniref:Uncharacterized protein n=1 Tax=Tenebrio molitor TaxID=7067 RepID=A0A8J6HKE3_TENMO|nr:hypothetical protein GEV33_006519 [Tenebrio molitor]